MNGSLSPCAEKARRIVTALLTCGLLLVSALLLMASLRWAPVQALTLSQPLPPAEPADARISSALVPITITAEADAYTSSLSPKENYGTATSLAVARGGLAAPFIMCSFLRFDVSKIPTGAVIQSAELRLYLNAWSGTSPYTVEVRTLNAGWVETELNWSNQPSPGVVIDTRGLAPSEGYRVWSIPAALVQQWRDDPRSNYGLVLVPGPLLSWNVTFNSREAKLNHPLLVIEYTLPTATPTATITPWPTRTRTATPTATATPSPTSKCPDPYEPNGTFANAWFITPDEYQSYICDLNDLDYFKFAAIRGDTIEVWLTDLPFDYELYLYDPRQHEVGHSDNAGTAEENIKFVVLEVEGDHYLLVGGKRDYSPTQPYTLRLKVTHAATPTPSLTPTPPRCGVDAWEPNDTFGTAASISPGRLQGLICPPGDVDFFRFSVNQYDTISLDLDSLPDNYNLRLWQPDGTILEQSVQPWTTPERIVRVAPSGGSYRAEVWPVTGAWHETDPYDLSVQVASPTPTRTATPTPTRTRTPTRTATPSPTPRTDLYPTYIEVNQAIEGDPFFFDPIWYKPTVVRVYVRTSLPAGSPCVPGVNAKLEVFRDSTSGALLTTLYPYNPGGEICAPVSPDWRELNHALNFDLPTSVLTGTIVLRPWVNYDNSVPENNYANNKGMTRTVRFRQLAKRISIAYVPIHYHPSGYSGAQDPSSRIHTAQSMLVATWPLRPSRVSYYPAPIPAVDWTSNVNLGGNDTNLLLHITELREDLDPRPDHLYGWLPGNVFGGNGLAWVGSFGSPQHAAFGNDTDGSPATSRYRRTFSHELEHNYGYNHDCDTLGGRGFDVLNRKVKSDSLFEVQCAGLLESQAWADIDTYWDKYQGWGYYSSPTSAAEEEPEAHARTIPPTAYVIASGIITSTQGGTSGELRPLHRVLRTEEIPPPEGTTYCLEFRAANDSVLQQNCFDLIFAGDSNDMPQSMPFGFTLLWPEFTAKVLLKYGDTVLDQRVASAHAPQVRLIAPNGGESWTGTQTVIWTASDADGDPLTFAVLYSRDGGTSWVPLTTGLSQTSFTFDTAPLAGGTQCLVKVRATDGFDTAEDVCDGTFTVPRRPPVATISAPTEGMTYGLEDILTLVGQGYDPEDGLLADDRLTWYDGATLLGTGSLLSAGPLAPGQHIITLRVQDSDGAVGMDSRTVYVGQPVTADIYLPIVVKNHRR